MILRRLLDFGETRWPLVLAVAGIALLVGVVALSLPPHEDGYQYIASAAFSADGLAIYRDYFHSQTPYMPLAMGVWTGWFAPDGPGLYLAARGFNLVWSLVFVLAAAALLWRLTRHGLWATALLVTVVTSSYLDLPLRVVRNDTMSLAFLTLALLACVIAQAHGPGRRAALGYGLAGLAMGVAVMTKQSYAFPALGLFGFALFMSFDSVRDRLRVATIPVVLGGLLGGGPGLWIVLTNWDVAHYALLEFHRTAHVGPSISDPEVGLTYADIFDWTALALPDLSAAALVVGVLVGLLWWRRRTAVDDPDRMRRDRRALWLCAFLIVPTIASFTLARPLFPQYAAPVLPVLALAVAVLVRGTGQTGLLLGGLLPVLVTLGALAGGVGALPHNPGNYNKSILDHAESLVRPPPPLWEGLPYFMRVTGDRRWMSQMLGPMRARLDAILAPDTRADLQVATLLAPYMQDAGLRVPPVFAGAPFFFVSNDDLSADMLDRLTGVSPSGLQAWADTTLPGAVLIGKGYFEDLTAGLEAHARAQGMICFEIDMRGAYRINTAHLFVSPDFIGDEAEAREYRCGG